MFAPRHIKYSSEFRKGVAKFVHYKRHLLSPEALADITARLDALRALEASRADRESLEAAHKELEETCQKALPGKIEKPDWLAENVDVIFTAIIIALGIRAYFVQPFKIPTGSMQPTLNGMRAKAIKAGEPFPSIPVRAWEWLWNARSYVDVKAKQDDQITGNHEDNFLLFFTSTLLETASGGTIKIPASQSAAFEQLGLKDFILRKRATMPPGQRGGIPVKAGETIVRGWVQGGDQLLVDKISYHFRRPSRGEVFVFNTKGIRGIESSGSFKPEYGSQHYIKRLCAVPGDKLEIQPDGQLFINGKRPEGTGFDRVMSKKDGYNGYLREVPNGDGTSHSVKLTEFSLRPGEYETTLGRFWREVRVPQPVYWAMGDNQMSSMDSRYWGPVPQVNVVGPAMIVYWPLGNHGGVIR